jgi:hypothetical protein
MALHPGRPPIYSDPAVLQRAIDAYFASCKAENQHPSITGLSLALGFSCRETVDEYAKKPDFSDTIKRAKLRVENAYVNSGVQTKNPGFQIFILKTMGYSDRMQVEHSGSIEGVIRLPQKKAVGDPVDENPNAFTIPG